MFADSHCHLDRLDQFEDVSQALKNARQVGVHFFLCVCIDLEHLQAVLAIAERHPDVMATVGVHPNELTGQAPTVEALLALADHPKVCALGETGLDYYRTQDAERPVQQAHFRWHIQAARQCNKPLVIHTRMAKADTISIMREEQAADVGGVMHCFTEDWAMAKEALDLGFYISFSGIVTFKNAAALREVALKVPLDRILIETDAPYLAPEPHRGKPNEPAYVRYVAEFIADLRGMPLDAFAAQTTQNYLRLFNIQP